MASVKKIYILFFFLSSNILFALPPVAVNTNPVITNVEVAISGNGAYFDITYEISDAEQNSVDLYVSISEDSGVTWAVGNAAYWTGDLGTISVSNVLQQKSISMLIEGRELSTFRVKLFANDNSALASNCGKVYYEGGPNDNSDGNGTYYNTVQIGSQCWLKESLNVGAMLVSIDSESKQTNNGVLEKYCLYNLESNCTIGGGLYQWAEAMQYQEGVSNLTPSTYDFSGNVQGICPSGWHIPTYYDLYLLRTAVLDEGNSLKNLGEGTGAGEGSNTSGFSALFNGWWNDTIFAPSEQTIFWLSEGALGYNVSYFYLTKTNSNVNIGSGLNKNYGFHVRCIKD